MKALIVGSKQLYNKLLLKYRDQLDESLAPVFTEDYAPMTYKLIESEHTQVIYICSPLYYQIKSMLNFALILKSKVKPNMIIKALIGDVRACKHGYIDIDSFEDTVTFNDKSIEYSVQRALDDLYYRTRQLINNYHPPVEYLNTPEFTTLCNAYDIELTTQLVPYLKSNVWHTTEDYRNKNGITDPLRCTVHVEERFAYKYEVTMYDKIVAWLSLKAYQDYNIQAQQRVVTDGLHYKVLDLAETPLSELEDSWFTTPIYTTEQLLQRDYIIPKSECTRLRKVGQPVDYTNLDISEQFQL